jgi:hypothetical protein
VRRLNGKLENMRKGLGAGFFNKRGMVTKAYAEGGRQEPQLAINYREQAATLHQSHPLFATVLEELATH